MLVTDTCHALSAYFIGVQLQKFSQGEHVHAPAVHNKLPTTPTPPVHCLMAATALICEFIN